MRNVLKVALLAAFVVMAAGAADAPPAPSPADATALVQKYLTDAARLRGQELTPEERASLTQQLAEERAALKNARKSMRLKAGAKPFGTLPDGAAVPKSVTQCDACKYVWTQINMQLGPYKFPASVVASFEHNCMGQMEPIFMKTCEDMYDDLYAMTDDWMDDMTSVCANAHMCPAVPPSR